MIRNNDRKITHNTNQTVIGIVAANAPLIARKPKHAATIITSSTTTCLSRTV